MPATFRRVLHAHVPGRPRRAGVLATRGRMPASALYQLLRRLLARSSAGGGVSPPRGEVRRRSSSRSPDASPVPPSPSRGTGRPLPSGENVGGLVVHELVVGLGQQPAGFVVEAAVAG